jgi:hypothetical protein
LTKYRYKLTKESHGSNRYGPCEICKKSADTIYHQSREEKYIRPDGTEGWKYAGDAFGHKTCLMKKRRK